MYWGQLWGESCIEVNSEESHVLRSTLRIIDCFTSQSLHEDHGAYSNGVHRKDHEHLTKSPITLGRSMEFEPISFPSEIRSTTNTVCVIEGRVGSSRDRRVYMNVQGFTGGGDYTERREEIRRRKQTATRTIFWPEQLIATTGNA